MVTLARTTSTPRRTFTTPYEERNANNILTEQRLGIYRAVETSLNAFLGYMPSEAEKRHMHAIVLARMQYNNDIREFCIVRHMDEGPHFGEPTGDLIIYTHARDISKEYADETDEPLDMLQYELDSMYD